MSGQGKVKGSLLLAMRDFVRKQHGEDAWQSLLADRHLTDADRALLKGMLLTGDWYPVGTWNRALAAWAERHPDVEKQDAATRELGRFVAEADLNALFRTLIGLSTPKFLAARVPMLYDYYFKGGKLESRQVKPGTWELTITGPTDEEEVPGKHLCRAGVSAWLDMALELNKTNGSVKHVSCRYEGKPRCEYTMSWS